MSQGKTMYLKKMQEQLKGLTLDQLIDEMRKAKKEEAAITNVKDAIKAIMAERLKDEEPDEDGKVQVLTAFGEGFCMQERSTRKYSYGITEQLESLIGADAVALATTISAKKIDDEMRAQRIDKEAQEEIKAQALEEKSTFVKVVLK